MTRDEAITIRSKIFSGSEDWKRRVAAEEIDNWVELGMLKLDEAHVADAQNNTATPTLAVPGKHPRGLMQ